MTWLDDFEADLLRMVQRDKPRAVKITDWAEETDEGGFCETCAYSQTIVEVTFECEGCGGKEGHSMSWRDHTWTWTGGLAQLMRELVKDVS